MRLSPQALFDAGAINCRFVRLDEEEGVIEVLRAKAVFVTESTVAACRNIEARLDLHESEIRRQEFSLGDIVVARVDEEGRTRGSVARNGQDAGVVLEFGVGDEVRRLPFSGMHMFAARETLLAMRAAGEDLGLDGQRALASIGEMFELARGTPDPARFSDELRGQAFRAALVDQLDRVDIGLSDDELGRYCTGARLRADIHALDPGNPDALSSRGTHADIVNEFGVTVGESSGARQRMVHTVIGTMTQGRAARANEALLRSIFGAVTSTPIEQLSVSMVQIDDFDYLRERMADRRLTGPWVDAFTAHAEALLRGGPVAADGSGAQNYRFETMLAQVEGRDFLLVRDEADGRPPAGYVYSWPTSDRHMLTNRDNLISANISLEEVPSEAEIARLTAVLNELRNGRALDYPEGDY